MTATLLPRLYQILLEDIGHLDWWPADTPFEVIIGTILTQQTKWTNVERAIVQLKASDLIEAEAMANAEIDLIEEKIRCCGFYHQKALRLRNIAAFFSENGLSEVLGLPVEQLRPLMLSLKGVGNETADSIILYAAEKPKFVIDAYTTRILKCLGIEGNYTKLQTLFEEILPPDVSLYKEYHALIVEYAKNNCTKKKCSDCQIIKKIGTDGSNGQKDISEDI